jgi:hypothetical protein
MQDLPKKDYLPKVKELVQKHFCNKMPLAIAKLYEDPKTSVYLRGNYLSLPGSWSSIFIIGLLTSENYSSLPVGLVANIEKLEEKQAEENKRHKALKKDTENLINGFGSSGPLLKALPEFSKYMPAEVPKIDNLPMCSSVLEALVEAGWPKEKK